MQTVWSEVLRCGSDFALYAAWSQIANQAGMIVLVSFWFGCCWNNEVGVGFCKVFYLLDIFEVKNGAWGLHQFTRYLVFYKAVYGTCNWFLINLQMFYFILWMSLEIWSDPEKSLSTCHEKNHHPLLNPITACVSNHHDFIPWGLKHENQQRYHQVNQSLQLFRSAVSAELNVSCCPPCWGPE